MQSHAGGRGRGRGTARGALHDEASASPSQATLPSPLHAGRGRGRGRGTDAAERASSAATESASIGGAEMEELSSLTSGMSIASQGSARISREPSSIPHVPIAEGAISPHQLTPVTTVARRPGYGKLGFPIPLRANFLEMSVKRSMVLHRYEVTVKDRRGSRILDRDKCRKIFWELVGQNRGIFGKDSHLVYDDANGLFTLERLSTNEAEVHYYRPLEFGRREDPDFSMTVKLTNEFPLDLNEEGATFSLSSQFLDSLVTQKIRCPRESISARFYPFLQSAFLVSAPGAGISMGPGMEAWTGLYSAVKVCQKGVMLNADISTKVFYKVDMPLISFYLEILNDFRERSRRLNEADLRQATMNERQRSMLSDALKGLVLKLNYGNNVHMKFTDVGPPSSVQRFVLRREGTDENREITVQEYFYEYKDIELKFPNLPVIVCGPPRRNIFVPMELLHLSDNVQRVKKRLTQFQLAKLLRGTALDPTVRFQNILEMMNDIKLSEDLFLKTFDTEISGNFVSINGRVLSSPILELHSGFRLETRDGKWPLENRLTEVPNDETKIPSRVAFASVIVDRAVHRSELASPLKVLATSCTLFGMQFAQSGVGEIPQYEYNSSNGVDELRRIVLAFEKECKIWTSENDQFDLRPIIIFIVPEQSETYGAIKTVCDREEGIASQVMQAKTFRNMKGDPGRNSVAHNLVLKINAKLGGINNKVDQASLGWHMFSNDNDPTLFIGVDVTHPAPGSRNVSIAAVVGSVDISATRYGCSLRIQRRGCERVVYMVDSVKERVVEFYNMTGKKPAHVVIFRDGICNSEFIDIMSEEMNSVRAALYKIDVEYNPTISYIVVQKKHHTRFYAEPREYARCKHNVPPGTVVDDVITSPRMFDFYLCSHYGAIGSSRPAHYTVLYDTWELTADCWQQMCYALCYVYVRCARSVSIPAPVYYADLACTRARYFLDFISRSRGSQSGGGAVLDDRAVCVHRNAPKMFFV